MKWTQLGFVSISLMFSFSPMMNFPLYKWSEQKVMCNGKDHNDRVTFTFTDDFFFLLFMFLLLLLHINCVIHFCNPFFLYISLKLLVKMPISFESECFPDYTSYMIPSSTWKIPNFIFKLFPLKLKSKLWVERNWSNFGWETTKVNIVDSQDYNSTIPPVFRLWRNANF